MLSSTGKNLLKHSIAHTEVHNKAWEERETWRQWEAGQRIKKRKRRDRELVNYDDERRKRKFKKEALQQHSKELQFPKGPLPFTKTLLALEGSDPLRWDHSGYEELYPEQFGSDSESVNDIDKPSSSSQRYAARQFDPQQRELSGASERNHSPPNKKHLKKHSKARYSDSDCYEDKSSHKKHKKRKSKRKSK